MQPSSVLQGRVDRWGAAAGSLAIAVLGALIFLSPILGIGPLKGGPHFGTDIYDHYYLAILEGRLDLPARVLRYEGHFAPDGTAFLYHGVAPLLTRFALGWALPLPQVSLAPFSIWFWSVLGTGLYHLTFLEVARKAWPSEREGGRSRRMVWALILAAAVWLGTPGLLLMVAPSLYHEPLAVAYAMTAAFIFLWVRAVMRGSSLRWILPGLALCAAITLHARPNLAVGLYAGTCLAVALCLWSGWRLSLVPAFLALGLLAAGGLGYLGLNAARFGSVSETHGSFDAAAVQYGPIYWGIEDPEGARAKAFTEHGRFNLLRIPANLALYALDVPAHGPAIPLSQKILSLFQAATVDHLGFIRVEYPRMGIVWLWSGWLLLAAGAALASPVRSRFPGLIAATVIGAVITLSYGTVTLRYRFDLWPAVAVLAACGLFALAPRLAEARPRSILPRSLGIAAMMGIYVTLLTSYGYRDKFSTEGGFYTPWSYEECLEKALARFAFDRASEICRLPDPAGDTR